MHPLSGRPDLAAAKAATKMKGSSGQAMVPASISSFPNSTLFNDSICRQQDRLNGVLYPATGALSLAVAPGCCMALDRTGVWVYQPARWLWEPSGSKRAANPVPWSTGDRPLAEACPRAALLPLHILRFSSSSKVGAGSEQDCILVFSLPVGSTCWPKIWSSRFTRRRRDITSTKYNTLSQQLINCVSVHQLPCNGKGVLASSLPGTTHTYAESHSLTCGPNDFPPPHFNVAEDKAAELIECVFSCMLSSL